MFRRKKEKKVEGSYETVEKSINEVFEKSQKSSDFSTISPLEKNDSLLIGFYKTMIDPKILQESILPPLKEKASAIKELSDLKNIIPIQDIKISKDPVQVEKALHDGAIVIYFTNKKEEFALLNIGDHRLGQREINDTQNEFSVIGSKVGFIEDLTTNLHLLRDHLNTSDLIFKEIIVGTRMRT